MERDCIKLEAALRNLLSAIGECTCAGFWAKYNRTDPACVYHDCESEIKAANEALAEVEGGA